VTCRVLRLELVRSWGDRAYAGLTGLEVLLGGNALVANLDASCLHANPRDLSSIGLFDDPRVPENLLDGVNDTTDDCHMWLVPYTPGGRHELSLDMGTQCKVAGINIWNYNKSSEDVFRGVRLVNIYIDDEFLGPQELRIGPACDGVEFKQTVLFRDVRKNKCRDKDQLPQRLSAPPIRQDYETVSLPSGMLWTINIYSNWGDGYYVGLDGLEFVDCFGKVIDLSKCASISSSPHMWDLVTGEGDIRVPGNLCQRRGGWLAPLAQCITREEQLRSVARMMRLHKHSASNSVSGDEHDPQFCSNNVLFVMFHQPVAVAAVRFFNYSKSPKRGVRHFGLEVDHRVVYMGHLEAQDSSNRSNLSEGQSVVFSSDPALVQSERSKASYCGSTDQDVLCINDRKVIIRSKTMYESPSVASEGIYSDLAKRPTTAALL